LESLARNFANVSGESAELYEFYGIDGRMPEILGMDTTMKTILVLLALMPMGAGALAEDLEGHYFLEGVREVGSELMLKPDGTFEYMLAYGAADYSATGKWRHEGDSVILNSALKEDPPFRLIKSGLIHSPGTRVWVKAPNGRPVEHIDVVLQSTLGPVTQRTDENGAAFFPDVRSSSAATMQVRVYQLEAGPYALDTAHNEFTFEINGEAITTVPFKNERLKVSGRSLEMRYWGDDRAMIYRRH
jgi:hypothetical protein